MIIKEICVYSFYVVRWGVNQCYEIIVLSNLFDIQGVGGSSPLVPTKISVIKQGFTVNSCKSLFVCARFKGRQKDRHVICLIQSQALPSTAFY